VENRSHRKVSCYLWLQGNMPRLRQANTAFISTAVPLRRPPTTESAEGSLGDIAVRCYDVRFTPEADNGTAGIYEDTPSYSIAKAFDNSTWIAA
jgi:hypothetical protein